MDIVLTKDILGADEDEGDLATWLVANGAQVAEGDPIAEVETGKAIVQVVAPASGKITIQKEAGEVVSVDDLIAVIE